MLEDIGLHLTQREYDDLVHILEFDHESIESFKDLCFSIVESNRGKIECWFMNCFGTWRNPKEIYNTITENHQYIPIEEFKDFLNEYLMGCYIDDLEEDATSEDVKECLNWALEDCFDVTGGVVKTSYC